MVKHAVDRVFGCPIMRRPRLLTDEVTLKLVVLLFDVDLHVICRDVVLEYQLVEVVVLDEYIADLVGQVVFGRQVHRVSLKFIEVFQLCRLVEVVVELHFGGCHVLQLTDVVLELGDLLAGHHIVLFLLVECFLSAQLSAELLLVAFIPFYEDVLGYGVDKLCHVLLRIQNRLQDQELIFEFPAKRLEVLVIIL
jgi:hypothetical protein